MKAQLGFLTVAFLLFPSITFAAGDIYKCQSGGKVTYSSIPCAGGGGVILKDGDAPRSDDEKRKAKLEKQMRDIDDRSKESARRDAEINEAIRNAEIREARRNAETSEARRNAAQRAIRDQPSPEKLRASEAYEGLPKCEDLNNYAKNVKKDGFFTRMEMMDSAKRGGHCKE